MNPLTHEPSVIPPAVPVISEAPRSRPTIRQLPPEVITKIAAGEVIERPASVVKELLENSVDAGSTRIDLELEQGGIERITVADDGCGMPAEQLPLAFASHATSKLADADDLFRIGTLGFRGEALASIAGVARVSIQSRPTQAFCGSEMHSQGGSLSALKPWNGSAGTRIDVRHLFFNTPVRKRFLRGPGTEFGHCDETFTRLALAHPHVHWSLSHNGKRVHEVPSSAGLLDRIGLFFGKAVREALFDLQAEQGPVTLAGYIANPSCDRGNARTQYLFVNGRWIRDRSLTHALQEAYRGLLMTGRYAVAFLFLDLPADAVDVNVHPTKAEVRFRDAQSIYHLVRKAVRERLSQAHLVPRLMAPPESTTHTSTHSDSHASIHISSHTSMPMGRAADNLLFVPAPPVPLTQDPVAEPRPPAIVAPPTPALPAATRVVADAPKSLQLHDAYLVVETPEGMLVIDQHALHERILFEQLKRRAEAGPLERQRLLIPEPVDLTSEQAARVLDHAEALADIGLEVSDLGQGTVLLSSYPALLRRATPSDVFLGVVDFLMSRDRPPGREQLLNDLLSTMACKAAVKAGDPLTPDEIAALLSQRELAADTHHCPHGRPTQLLFSRQDLDRQFRRI